MRVAHLGAVACGSRGSWGEAGDGPSGRIGAVLTAGLVAVLPAGCADRVAPVLGRSPSKNTTSSGREHEVVNRLEVDVAAGVRVNPQFPGCSCVLAPGQVWCQPRFAPACLSLPLVYKSPGSGPGSGRGNQDR